RCHDHKFDPISQREFYSLFAFFQNVAEAGQPAYFTGAMPVPTLLLSTDEQDQQLAELEAAIAGAEGQLGEVDAAAGVAFSAWLQQRPAGPQAGRFVGSFPFHKIAHGKSENLADAAKPAVAVESPAT